MKVYFRWGRYLRTAIPQLSICVSYTGPWLRREKRHTARMKNDVIGNYSAWLCILKDWRCHKDQGSVERDDLVIVPFCLNVLSFEKTYKTRGWSLSLTYAIASSISLTGTIGKTGPKISLRWNCLGLKGGGTLDGLTRSWANHWTWRPSQPSVQWIWSPHRSHRQTRCCLEYCPKDLWRVWRLEG